MLSWANLVRGSKQRAVRVRLVSTQPDERASSKVLQLMTAVELVSVSSRKASKLETKEKTSSTLPSSLLVEHELRKDYHEKFPILGKPSTTHRQTQSKQKNASKNMNSPSGAL